MKRKLIRHFLVFAATALIVCARFAAPACAESLSDHFSVWCDAPEAAGRLPVAMAYAREGNVMADGMLHFMPLKDFIEREYDAPVVTFRGSPVYHVDYDAGFFDGFRESVTFYEPSEEKFSAMAGEDGQPVTMEDLRPGDYLMAVNISAEKGEEYFAGASFIHIVIPGVHSFWPIRTEPVPTCTPEWTPVLRRDGTGEP